MAPCLHLIVGSPENCSGPVRPRWGAVDFCPFVATCSICKSWLDEVALPELIELDMRDHKVMEIELHTSACDAF